MMPSTQHDRAMSKVVVLRLVGGDMEGRWIEVRGDEAPTYIDPGGPVAWDTDDESPVAPAFREVTLIATGNVEWDGDRCAEVYVPEDMLDLWRAEHDVEDR